MKKVLILAYDFPPYNSIGSQRPASWLKYLPENNVDVTIVTRHWDKNILSPVDCIKPSTIREVLLEIVSDKSRVIRVPFSPNFRDRIILKYGLNRFVLIRKILSLLMYYLRFFISGFDNTNNIYKEADKYLKEYKVDLIIATGEPFILFKYGNLLSKKHNISWIADYRDCWNNVVTKKNSSIFLKIIKSISISIEKHLVNTSISITTPSPSYKTQINKLFPKKTIEVIYNGSDVDTNNIRDIKSVESYFEISYAGIVYPHQQLEMFLEGICIFLKNHKDAKLKMKFYGLNFYPQMKERLIKYNSILPLYIETTDRLNYDEVMKKLKEAHLLLLLSDEGADWLNAKIFDYLEMDRPILLVKNDKGILEKILNESGVGCKANNEFEVAKIITKMYHDFVSKNIKEYRTLNNEIYTRKKQAQKLSDFISEI